MTDWVTLESFARVIEARLAQAKLEGAGISSYLKDEAVASIDPFLIPMIGGVRLLVRAEDEEAAREVLADGRDVASIEPDPDPSLPRCPKCESEYAYPERFLGFETRSGRLVCNRCGHKGASETFTAYRYRRDEESLRQTPPVFRLLRRQVVAGGMVGVALGTLVSVILFERVGAFGTFAGLLLGVLVGARFRYAVCSEPSCRAKITPEADACSRCKRTIAGSIDAAAEHFVGVAQWRRARARETDTTLN
jgi:hypothetical protein